MQNKRFRFLLALVFARCRASHRAATDDNPLFSPFPSLASYDAPLCCFTRARNDACLRTSSPLSRKLDSLLCRHNTHTLNDALFSAPLRSFAAPRRTYFNYANICAADHRRLRWRSGNLAADYCRLLMGRKWFGFLPKHLEHGRTDEICWLSKSNKLAGKSVIC